MRHDLFSIRRTFPLLLLLLIFALTAREIMDPDFWWHLRTGQYIVQSHTIPRVDIFSSTFAGKPWLTHEWLSEVFMYSLYRAGGWTALILAFSLIITSAFFFAYLRCAGKPFIAASSVAFAALASFPNWGVRPQMITLLLVSIFLWVLDDHAVLGTRCLWWLVPLMALWVNIHAGFSLGICMIFFFLVATALEAVPARNRSSETMRRLSTLVYVFVACIAVIPLNPNGAKLYLYPLETLHSSAMRTYLSEWQSPDFHNSAFTPFAALLLITFAVLAVSPKRVRISSLVLLSGASYAALQSVRHIPLFAIIAAPILAEHLAELPLWARVNEKFESSSPALNTMGVVTLILVGSIGVLRISRVLANQSAWERTEFPAAAVEFLQTQRPPGPIYNPYHWGGYLIWKAYPAYPVFIDGRADVYGDAFVLQYFQAARGHINALKQLDHYAIKTAIAETKTPLAALLRNDPHWTAVFQNNQAVIFVRN
jgi:hypothetical protein